MTSIADILPLVLARLKRLFHEHSWRYTTLRARHCASCPAREELHFYSNRTQAWERIQ